MQQMDQEKTGESWQTHYAGYEGEQREAERGTRSAGQKLENDDEQYAVLLARRINQELKDELDQGKNTGLKERMTLAISSVWAAAVVFGILVLALTNGVTGNNTIALGYGVVAAMIAIIAVNTSFNRATIEMRKNQSKQESQPEQKQKS